MWGDGGRCKTSRQEVDEIDEVSKDPFCLVRGGITHCLPEVAWSETRRSRSRTFRKGPHSSLDYRLTQIERRRHRTRGEGGRGSLGVLVQHLPQDLSGGSGQTVRDQGLDGFAVLAIMNSQFSSPDVVTPLRS